MKRPNGDTTKRCPKCQLDYSLSEFYPTSKNAGFVVIFEDGSKGWRYSYCRRCLRKRVAKWQQSDEGRARQRVYQERWEDNGGRERKREYARSEAVAERRRERYRKRREMLKRNPHLLAQEREKGRLYAWEARRRAGTTERGPSRVEMPVVDREPRLRVAPFLEWFDHAFALWRANGYGNGLDDFCADIGISARNVLRMRQGEQQTIRLDTVDRVLLVEGSTNLYELYPDLYDEVAV